MLNGELDKVSRFYNGNKLFFHAFFFYFISSSCNCIEKEQEARTKLEALKIQMQLIAEYGRRLLEIGVCTTTTSTAHYAIL